MKIEKFVLGPVMTNTYIVYDENTKKGVIFDPADEGEILLDYIEREKLIIKYILLTHGHFDHIGAVKYLTEHLNIPYFIHKKDLDFIKNADISAKHFGLKIENPPLQNNFVKEGDKFNIGEFSISVLETPGHSQGSVSYLIKEENNKIIISGDLIFKGNIGRVDLPGGDFNTLLSSVRKKIFPLGNDTVILPGHEGETTIAAEKKFNPYFRGK